MSPTDDWNALPWWLKTVCFPVAAAAFTVALAVDVLTGRCCR